MVQDKSGKEEQSPKEVEGNRVVHDKSGKEEQSPKEVGEKSAVQDKSGKEIGGNLGLTGVKELDMEILRYLTDKELSDMCRINNYFRDICQNENFWRLKVLDKYGVKDKPVNKTWKEFYIEKAVIPLTVVKIRDRLLDNILNEHPIMDRFEYRLTISEYKKLFRNEPKPLVLIIPNNDYYLFSKALLGFFDGKSIIFYSLRGTMTKTASKITIICNENKGLFGKANDIVIGLVQFLREIHYSQNYTIDIGLIYAGSPTVNPTGLRNYFNVEVPVHGSELIPATPMIEPHLGKLSFKYKRIDKYYD